MKKVFGAIKLTLQIIMCVFILFLLIFNICAMVQRTQGKQIPVVFGYSFAVVVSGSMEPEISINDVVIIKAQDKYKENDVITFCDTRTGEYVTHRIILVSEDGKYLTKGDANNTDDKLMIPNEVVVGKVVGVMRGVGVIIQKMQTPLGIFVLLAIGIVFWVAVELIDRICLKIKRQKDEQETESDKQGE